MPESFLPLASIHLRDARPGDAPAIWRALYPPHSLASVELMLEQVMALVAQGRAVFAVAEQGGEVRATAQLSIAGDRGEIHHLEVAEGWRERGLGRALIGYLTGAARARGVRLLEIGAEASNARAVALYQRLGFRVDRTADLDLGEGVVQVVYLSKRLE